MFLELFGDRTMVQIIDMLLENGELGTNIESLVEITDQPESYIKKYIDKLDELEIINLDGNDVVLNYDNQIADALNYLDFLFIDVGNEGILGGRTEGV